MEEEDLKQLFRSRGGVEGNEMTGEGWRQVMQVDVKVSSYAY